MMFDIIYDVCRLIAIISLGVAMWYNNKVTKGMQEQIEVRIEENEKKIKLLEIKIAKNGEQIHKNKEILEEMQKNREHIDTAKEVQDMIKRGLEQGLECARRIDRKLFVEEEDGKLKKLNNESDIDVVDFQKK